MKRVPQRAYRALVAAWAAQMPPFRPVVVRSRKESGKAEFLEAALCCLVEASPALYGLPPVSVGAKLPLVDLDIAVSHLRVNGILLEIPAALGSFGKLRMASPGPRMAAN